jgi:hypothetical protein
VEVRRHRPGGDCPTAVAAHPARRGTHSRAPRSPARSTDGPSGKRCRARAVRGTRTPMTSWRQWQANRLNAVKSTGPRTEEGKRISRRNALRHGLTAETVIDGLEDSEDYRGFEAVISRTTTPRRRSNANSCCASRHCCGGYAGSSPSRLICFRSRLKSCATAETR